MNVLVIDAGNTRIKLAVFSGMELLWKDAYSVLSVFQLEELVANWNLQATLVSSVVFLDKELTAFLQMLPNYMLLEETTPLPITNKYESPQTLGRDRLANATGAAMQYPGADLLIIDAGTCLKFDYIDRYKNYYGGSIAPGLKMRYEALHHFTDKLPLLSPMEASPLTGIDTDSSIHSGVLNGTLAEVNGMIDQYRIHYANIELILTGGDSRYFLNHLKKPIFADPELTLKGLNFILQHNIRI